MLQLDIVTLYTRNTALSSTRHQAACAPLNATDTECNLVQDLLWLIHGHGSGVAGCGVCLLHISMGIVGSQTHTAYGTGVGLFHPSVVQVVSVCVCVCLV